MTKKLLGFFLVIIFFGCDESKNSNTEFKNESSSGIKKETTKKEVKTKVLKEEKIDEAEKLKVVFTEFKDLYKELMGFKNDKDFKRLGFGKGGKYNNWLQKVKVLKQNTDSKLLLKKGILIGELEQLGLAYASSRGKETKVTKTFNEIFSKVISDEPKENKKSSASTNINYSKLKDDYEFFGKWTIANTIVKESYPYEIYKKDNKYIGVRLNDFKIENLVKKGNDYYVKGNKYGEFYRIDQKMNMILFDKDGDLTSAGYRATKVR